MRQKWQHLPSEIWEARFPVFSCFILFSSKRGSFDFVPRTANEWLYPRKSHNHNVDLGALGTAPNRTRRSLRRNWNSLTSSETLASHADGRSSSVVTCLWGYWNTQDEKIAMHAVQLATLQTFDGSCFWLLTVQDGTLSIYNHIEILWFFHLWAWLGEWKATFRSLPWK